MAINGQIVDEINGLIASRDSIRTTMKAAGIASDTSKLADLATNLAAAKLGATTYNVSASGSITIPKGKLTTGDQTIVAKDLASQTSGTAAAGDILSGKTAWVGGKRLTGSMPNGGVSVAAAGTLTKQPSISKQSITNISGITDAAADIATTTAPTSSSTYKAWVKVKSAANTASYTPTATKTEGWVSGGSVTGTAGTYGAIASADTYIPIKNGAYSASVSTTAGSASMSATGVSTATSSNCYITLSTTAGKATGKATVGTAGWVNTGSTSSSESSVSVNGNGTKLYLATYTPSTIAVTNSSQTLSTNGKVCTGNITIPAVNYYYTSLEVPTNSEGNNGDIWLVVNP